MAWIPEAVDMIQQTEKLPVYGGRLYYTVQIRILRRTGRNREAVRILRRVLSETSQTSWTDDGQAFNLHFHILLAELAVVQLHVGQVGKALEDAERAVTACQRDMADKDMEEEKCAFTHSLTTLSHCLAAVGSNEKALEAAEKAVSIYTVNVSRMWGNFRYTIRRQELGASAFHSMSLRLATFGQLEEALSNAEKASELYRELVSLAPRHRPSLAGSLRNLASTLWNVGRRDESISTSEEAVDIMRKVADPETYFLGDLAEGLDQLVRYLSEKGAADRAIAASSEAAEVRRRIELLPPEPEFLFSEIETEEEEEDDEGKDPSSSTAIELEVVALEATSANDSQDNPKTCSPSEISSIADPLRASVQLVPQPVDGAQRERHAAADRITGTLVVPLEAKSSRTPTDLLLWIWLGLLSVLVAIMGVGLAVMWRRGQ
ncbi:hypothetical protein B0H17DRAFT_1196361 [Mycena rosella]|uniref:Anaphase-promoting complex subunit 5 domain-containing protein n=1 Tax=Mycena rosella TaxID=1033263 RepID=A0AAD7DW60_MYCRO|nr:hypothetical protein B0H17DRAFT_1196361 [Mycena rosella]